MEKEIKKEMQPTPEPKKDAPGPSPEIKERTIMAIIAYVVFFIPLLVEAKNDPAVKYHTKQGMVLFVAWVAAAIVSGVPVIGWMLSAPLTIAGFVLLVIGILNAYHDRQKPLPLIGKYAEQINI